jgi:hypothetical protein
MKSFKRTIQDAAVGAFIGVVILLVIVQVRKSHDPPAPIVCMQDAPIAYDWNNNLIVEKMYE